MSDFFYQAGSVTTNTLWTRPFYEKIVGFLQDKNVHTILKKYDAYLHGGILWNTPTWDLDILLKLDWTESTDWNQIETDINNLNNIALNQHRLLLDVSVTNKLYKFLTKQQLAEINRGKSVKDWIVPRLEKDIKIRLDYFKKIKDGTCIEYFETRPHKKLTNGHLCEVDLSNVNHDPKIAHKIMSTSDLKPPILQIQVNLFLEMTKEEFMATINDSIETF